MYGRLVCDNSYAKAPIQVTKVDLLNLMWDSKQLDAQLLRHVLAGAEATANQKRVSLSWVTDHANVGGPTLASGAWAMPNNVANILVPQVTGRWAKGGEAGPGLNA